MQFLRERLRFFKCWLGIFYMSAAISIAASLKFYPQYSYYVMVGCFALFWFSLGAYLFFRHPVKAEAALWNAVEKKQAEQRAAEDAGMVRSE